MGLVSGFSLASHSDSESFLVVHALFSQDGCQWEGFWEVVGHVVSPFKVKGEVAQSCPTLCDPVDCNLLDFSVHGIFQARILEWVAISFSRGSSRPKDWTQVLLNCRQIVYHLSHREVLVKHSEEGLWALRKDGGHLGSFPRVCWINPKPVFFYYGSNMCYRRKVRHSKVTKRRPGKPSENHCECLGVYVSRSVDICFKMSSHCTLQLSLSSIHARLFI